MKVCKKNGDISAKEVQLVNHYIYSLKRYGLRTLWDCYKNPSVYKLRSWENISDMARCDGEGLTVVGYNCDSYSCAFISNYIEDGRTHHVLRYYTKDYQYTIELRGELLDNIIKSGFGGLL